MNCVLYIHFIYTKHHPIQCVYIYRGLQKVKIDLGNPLLILKYYTIFCIYIFNIYMHSYCSMDKQW